MYHGKNSTTNKFKKSTSSTSSGTALAAVAFQDHLVRSMALSSVCSPSYRIGSQIPHYDRHKFTVKSVIDTGRVTAIMKPKKKESVEKEFVLDAKPPPPTLAQKLGIFDPPRQLLSEAEWTKVKKQSNERDDSRQPCVICKDDFGREQQVLLSCTHVFHRACLEAFERFSGKKNCPLCRKEQYQTMVIYEGAKLFRDQCAARIQAHWRGYVVRSWYKKLRETNPPKNPLLRKKFFEEKMASITDRMVRSLDTNVGELFSEIDRNIQASRRLFAQMEARMRVITEDEWMAIEEKALARNDCECPICLGSLRMVKTISVSDVTKKVDRKRNQKVKVKAPIDGQSKSLRRPAVLLTCSHIFHWTCVETFEDLVSTEEGQLSSCPVCRSAYQKRTIIL